MEESGFQPDSVVYGNRRSTRVDDTHRTRTPDGAEAPAADHRARKGTVRSHADLTEKTRLRLMVLLPLTMAVLVASTGFFTLRMAGRYYMIYGLVSPGLDRSIAQLEVQVAMIALIAALLGIGLALGVTTPLKEMADRLEAIASGDLRGGVEVRSTTEVDSLAGAFNEAIGAINQYIFQSMTGAVITLNPEGRVIASGPAAEAVLGYREEEIVGKRFSEVFAPAPEGRGALAAIEAAIARRETVAADNVVIAAKDGRPIRIGVNVSYLRPRGAQPGRGTAASRETDEAVGVMIAFKDLTEIRRLRDRLQQADQLVALGTLTAGVAHELRNPLASLQGLVELLGRDFESQDPKRRYVQTMLDAIARLNRLVEDLLLLSSPGVQAAEEFDLNHVVHQTVELARHGLGDKVVTLASVEAPGGAPVVGSAARLGQALTNVVLNAVQATPEGGTITVTAGRGEDLATIRVHNTGSYIAPEQVKQIFVPFFTTKKRGTGLGLAIARQIMTAHGGRIDVESDRGTGTTFLIDLPLVPESRAGDVTRQPNPAASGAMAPNQQPA
jgi:PAS domain S-box-containing protein